MRVYIVVKKDGVKSNISYKSLQVSVKERFLFLFPQLISAIQPKVDDGLDFLFLFSLAARSKKQSYENLQCLYPRNCSITT